MANRDFESLQIHFETVFPNFRGDKFILFHPFDTMTTLGSWSARRRARVNEFVVVALALFVVHSAVFLIASVAAKDWRYSRFFNANDYIQRSSMRDQQRLESAANYFDQIQANNTRSRKNNFYDPNRMTLSPGTSNAKMAIRGKPEYCIGIPSVIKRKGNYVLQLAHHLMTQLSPEEQQRATVVILGSTHDNSDVQALSQVFPVMQINHTHTKGESDAHKVWVIDESYDYADLLEECSKKATYTIILEDDVIGSKHWISKLDNAPTTYKPSLQDLGFIKLFYTEHWQGWSNDDIPMLIIVGVSFAALCWLFLSRSQLRKPTKIVIAVLIGADATFFVYSMGRQHLYPFKQGLYEFYSPCCTPAHVYNSALVPKINQCIRNKAPTAEPIDFVLDSCMKELQLKRYILVPNLFQHIGLYSTASNKNQGDYLGMKTSLSFDDE